MNGYLGEIDIDINETEFKNSNEIDWIRYFINEYCGIDGSHHKQWLIDQILRITLGTKIKIKKAQWHNGNEEYRISLKEPPREYFEWIEKYENGEDGPQTYSYDPGIAP